MDTVINCRKDALYRVTAVPLTRTRAASNDCGSIVGGILVTTWTRYPPDARSTTSSDFPTCTDRTMPKISTRWHPSTPAINCSTETGLGAGNGAVPVFVQ